jgi:hypothetical protein
MKGITIVPLRFTSMTSDKSQVGRDKPLYAFLYNILVSRNGLRKFILNLEPAGNEGNSNFV